MRINILLLPPSLWDSLYPIATVKQTLDVGILNMEMDDHVQSAYIYSINQVVFHRERKGFFKHACETHLKTVRFCPTSDLDDLGRCVPL